MNTAEVLVRATEHLEGLVGHTFDVLSVARPASSAAAINHSKVVSKLSPIVGNLIEFGVVDVLNDKPEFSALGKWVRQDPGFPDAVFEGVLPRPGIEIKAWFPLATEMTGRFRESQRKLQGGNINVAVIAWMPEHIIWGSPRIVGVCVVPALSVAQARDNHYHKPPDYLVVEPEDTTARTGNLQQTNTAGYKFQGSSHTANPVEFRAAENYIHGWSADFRRYSHEPECQTRIKDLMNRWTYRLDTNFAKMDRIDHPQLEDFITRIEGQTVGGLSVRKWQDVIGSEDDAKISAALQRAFDLRSVVGAPPVR